ncbi:MAG: STAS/SEC14 domain-containing protein [Acidobacteriota bacterium]|nr:STAS/SEC14 domain-containing protein [Acidobacteriota bacterium]
MIEHLQQTRGPAFGFAVHGVLTAADTTDLTAKLDYMIGDYKKPIGVLADLSKMEGADWKARWIEMRFLERYTAQIARLAIVGASDWEEIASMLLVATAALQAQTIYFKSSELSQAWHWVKMLKHDEDMPFRLIHPGHGLFQDYTPEYVGI